MLARTSAAAFLSCSVFLLAGCSGGTPDAQGPPAGRADVTLHVEKMAEKQNVTWETWPNEVKEALSGFPGVEKVKWDWKRDLLTVRYDPERVNPQKMIQLIEKQGYPAKVVQDGTK